ncbi:hypothetical protein [Massilia sp. BSC265]|uniref:hypothetical protein n=1 Tax=Massilia sp. BSC265 TaxID=1549812 RepID=UPI0004E971E0|nr:hypothetical protein [Massilia sp. BSC265]KFI09004.1 hypothetical protein JN27_00665 [Massilia sp. BSC265]
MEKRELHYVYGISYLVVIIVALVAFALFDVEHLVDKISFALTITSLVLAILAIIYTYIAGGKQEGQLTTLITTNQAITTASSQIQAAANALLGHVSEIPKGLQNLNDKLDTLSARDLSNVLPGEEVKSSNSSFDLTSEVSSVERDNANVVDMKSEEEILKDFIGKIPFFGMGMLYAFWRAFRNDKEISESWVEENYAGNYLFMLGIFYGARGAGLIDFKVRDGEIIPTACSESMHNSIARHLAKVMEVTNEENSEKLRNYMALADKTFNRQS